jgi:hypothetical protein
MQSFSTKNQKWSLQKSIMLFNPTNSIAKKGFQIRIFINKKLLGDAEKTDEVNLVIVTRK